MEIISRTDALRRGLVRYFTGIPCKYGHVVERRASSKQCIMCHRASVARWEKTNPDRIKVYRHTTYVRHTPKFRARRRRYYEHNYDLVAERSRQWAADNPDKCRAKVQRWARANPAKVAANCARRRGYKLQRTPKWLTVEHHAHIASVYAAAKVRGCEVDHVHPLCGKLASGLHVPWNLQLLSAPDNRRKYNKSPVDVPFTAM